jgi:hypothetical protein
VVCNAQVLLVSKLSDLNTDLSQIIVPPANSGATRTLYSTNDMEKTSPHSEVPQLVTVEEKVLKGTSHDSEFWIPHMLTLSIVLVALAEDIEAQGQLTLTTDYNEFLNAVTGSKRNYSNFYAIFDVFSHRFYNRMCY